MKGFCLVLLFAIASLVVIAMMVMKKRTRTLTERDYILTKIRSRVEKKWPHGFDANTFLDVPVLYINLEKSIARRKHMETSFSSLGLSNAPVRIDAVHGENYLLRPWTESWIHPTLHRRHKDLLERQLASPGELGCLLSHFKALHFSHTIDAPAVLILEDDIDFSCVGLWEDSLLSLTLRAPHDWNFIQLYRGNDSCLGQVTDGLYKQRNGTACMGTVAYLVSKKAIDKLYDLLFIDDQLSEEYFLYCRQRNLRFASDSIIYNLLEPNNVYFEKLSRFSPDNTNEELDSTIHVDHTNGHIQRATNILKAYMDCSTSFPSAEPSLDYTL